MAETMQQMWESFARDVLPRNCSTVQRWEMRRAFMAGAWALLTSVKAIGGEEAGQGAEALEAFERELRRFNRDVKEGRA